MTANAAKPRRGIAATPTAKPLPASLIQWPWSVPWSGSINPWNFGAGFVFLILHVALDRMTVDFQMWKGVSAWYPPAGLEVAVLLGLGFSYIAASTPGHLLDPQEMLRLADDALYRAKKNGRNRCELAADQDLSTHRSSAVDPVSPDFAAKLRTL